jgi:PhoPQ-activated pathogenicity-related protein
LILLLNSCEVGLSVRLKKFFHKEQNRHLLTRKVTVNLKTHKDKKMKRSARALVLILALASSIYAGDIQNGVTATQTSPVTDVIVILLQNLLMFI